MKVYLLLLAALYVGCTTAKWWDAGDNVSGAKITAVGMAEGIKSMTLRRQAADASARAALARIVKTYATSVSRAFQLQSDDGDATEYSSVVENVTEAVLSGIYISQRHQEGDVLYAEASLAKKRFIMALKANKELSKFNIERAVKDAEKDSK